MRIRNYAVAFGMALLMPLAAQGQEIKRFDVSGGAVFALDTLKTVTNKTFSGIHLDAGFNGNLAATTIPFRASLGVNLLPGSEKDGLKVSLTGFQLNGDIFVKTGVDKLRLVSGISLNKWRAKAEAAGVSETETIKGIKFGGRLGLDYGINSNLSCGLMLQVVELGTDAGATRGINPSWVELGVRYSF
jgi:hypothetical protein